MSWSFTLGTASGNPLPLADDSGKGAIPRDTSITDTITIAALWSGASPPSSVDVWLTPDINSVGYCIEGSPSSSQCRAKGSWSHGGTNLGNYDTGVVHTPASGAITTPVKITISTPGGAGSTTVHVGCEGHAIYSPVPGSGAGAEAYIDLSVAAV